MMSAIRRYIMAGLLVWLPLGVTILVVKMLVDLMDRSLLLLPTRYQPEQLLGMHIPGLGVIVAVTVVLATGIVVANLFGRKLVGLWEGLLARIPLVSSVYSAVKQISETMFSSNGNSFRKVLLVEYPRKGLWTLAFQTGTDVGEAQCKTGREVINIYVLRLLYYGAERGGGGAGDECRRGTAHDHLHGLGGAPPGHPGAVRGRCPAGRIARFWPRGGCVAPPLSVTFPLFAIYLFR
jgi:uncharacterized membrane protein